MASQKKQCEYAEKVGVVEFRCEGTQRANGLCHKHDQFRRRGNPIPRTSDRPLPEFAHLFPSLYLSREDLEDEDDLPPLPRTPGTQSAPEPMNKPRSFGLDPKVKTASPMAAVERLADEMGYGEMDHRTKDALDFLNEESDGGFSLAGFDVWD